MSGKHRRYGYISCMVMHTCTLAHKHSCTHTHMRAHHTHTQDGRLQKGDRILAVNGESFTNLTREKALTILTQLKLR